MTKQNQNITAVVLAAGQSTRMGNTNKLLAVIDGTPMIRRIVDQVHESKNGSVIVVVGFQADRVRQSLSGCDVTFVQNDDYEDGLSTSLKRGLDSLSGNTAGAMICLGDMPHLQTRHIDQLIDMFHENNAQKICVPMYQGQQGNPVVWPSKYIDEMKTLTGDQGAKGLLKKYADDILEVTMSDDGTSFDVDTPDALQRIQN